MSQRQAEDQHFGMCVGSVQASQSGRVTGSKQRIRSSTTRTRLISQDVCESMGNDGFHGGDATEAITTQQEYETNSEELQCVSEFFAPHESDIRKGAARTLPLLGRYPALTEPSPLHMQHTYNEMHWSDAQV